MHSQSCWRAEKQGLVFTEMSGAEWSDEEVQSTKGDDPNEERRCTSKTGLTCANVGAQPRGRRW